MNHQRRRRTVDPDNAPPQAVAESAATNLADSSESLARSIVLRWLTAAPRTRKQLADRLAERGIPADAASAVLDRFEDVKLIDDVQFAQMWVRSRHAGRGLARKALMLELRQKGVSADIIEHALVEVDDEDEYFAALKLVRRKAKTMGRADEQTQRRRLQSMLMRRGHAPAVAARAVQEVMTTTET